MPEPELIDLVTKSDAELVFGVVAAVGTDVDACERHLADLLHQFGYSLQVAHLSKIAKRMLEKVDVGVTVDESTPYKRYDTLMTLGNTLRGRAQRGDVLALQAILEINERRVANNGAPQEDPVTLPKTVHFVRSLKHPHEVEAFRRVYGPGFFLIGIHAPQPKRLHRLTEIKGISQELAQQLLDRDQSETDKLGQQTRDTFALADVFVADDHGFEDLTRFVDLVFGAPFITPTREEDAMFMAHAASLRSAQFARQVGAVIAGEHGDIIATGANDVPRYGGGLYWPGSGDQRDHIKGFDSNDRAIEKICEELCDLLFPTLHADEREERIKQIKTTRLGDITEFGRVVHAEMDALLTCSRLGHDAKGATLYTTTFPCHNCAKHIVAAGIARVVYLQPYPKSQATVLHADSISLEDAEGRVVFAPFVGVGARRYFDLFSMKLGGGAPLSRKTDGRMTKWERSTGVPRFRMSPFGYIDREKLAIQLLTDDVVATIRDNSAPAKQVQANSGDRAAEQESL